MGKTSRIQLRGISRTPSDRMTEDGGCAESLNVQLDNTEVAPAFYPDDVTFDRGLPVELEADKIFIHKTANYENYIVVQNDKVVAYAPKSENKEPLLLLKIDNNSINDVASLGNTIVIATDDGLYYFLYKDRNYSYLGNGVPFPQIVFDKEEVDTQIGIDYSHTFYLTAAGTNQDTAKWGQLWFGQGNELGGVSPAYSPIANDLHMGRLPEEGEWTKENFVFNQDDSRKEKPLQYEFAKFKDHINDLLIQAYKEAKDKSQLSGNIFVRYAVELYSGALYSSMPILIKDYELKINVSQYTDIYTTEVILPEGTSFENGPYHTVRAWQNTAKVNLTPYDLYVSCLDAEKLKDWKDIIKSINIYISVPANFWKPEYFQLNNRTYDTYASLDGLNREFQHTESSGVVTIGDQVNAEQFLLNQSSQTYLVKSIPVLDERGAFTEEFLELSSRHKLEIDKDLMDVDKLMEQTRLTKDDMKHYPLGASSMSTFNNSFLLPNPTSQIVYDYDRLNTYSKYEKESTDAPEEYDIRYDVAFVIKGDAEDKIVYAQDFRVKQSADGSKSKGYDYYAFQTFPDNRAYKMIVKATKINSSNAEESVKYGELDMLAHPYLDCAYFYAGLDKTIFSLCDKDSMEMPKANSLNDTENKLYVSDVNDPFTFPLEKRYTFSGKVLGVAIVTTALSQGQFGQFPLYVFTEDGIWAMETASDGKFITQKPMSRHVCINPESITPLDDAVVFVTSQGVMMLQGSQVVNISPDMNGRHYVIESGPKTIIENQDFFCDLLPALSDNTHFLAYVKEATVAYDYAGRRLIFIKKDEKYQYIYKLDTKTWHKTAYGIKLVAPINSYPECLVMGETDEEERKFLDVHSFAHSQLDEYQLSEDFMSMFGDAYGLTIEQLVKVFVTLEALDITDWSDYDLSRMEGYLTTERVDYDIVVKNIKPTKVYDLSTILDAAESKTPVRGVIATRPFDLGEPDVFKTITDVRIRGQFPKGAVKFILLGSNDGINFATVSTLRGRAWKLFRMIILADLAPTERISWVDIMYETKFTNKLR